MIHSSHPRWHGLRDMVSSDLFNYIEMFYNTKRAHGINNHMSPVEYEQYHQQSLASI